MINLNHQPFGNIIVISAPSGAGKSSLVQAICTEDNNVCASISHTTRAKRLGEIDGENYHFVTTAQFNTMLKNNEFLEHALVYGNHYGTHRNTVNKLLAEGKDVILEIDCQGASLVQTLCPDAILIYILPPSFAVLKQRLVKRNTDNQEAIAQRLILAKEEILQAPKFAYIVINDNFAIAVHNLCSIITAQRFKTAKILTQYRLNKFCD